MHYFKYCLSQQKNLFLYVVFCFVYTIQNRQYSIISIAEFKLNDPCNLKEILVEKF